VQVLAALLAAGGGTRARGPGATGHKLTAVRDGRPLHRWALDALVEADVGEVVVVTGAVELDLPAGVRALHNPQWSLGQATSLRLATAAAEEAGAAALLIGLADQPGIPPSAWRAIADADDRWPIVVATYDGRRGPHPVRIHRSWWPELPGAGDEGARGLLRRRTELVHEVPCSGSPADIDTLEDLQRWTSP
jgi:CTP:molybdopterin cytidylyltransferase MocA